MNRAHSPFRYICCLFAVLLATSVFFSCGEEDPPLTPQDEDPPDYPLQPEDTLKVLFIGNSFTSYFDLPELFRQLAESAGKTVLVGRKLINGFPLEYFCQLQEVVDVVDSEDWHYVCLQGSGAALAYPELWGTIDTDGVDCMTAHVAANCSRSIPVYFMTWAYKDGLSWMEGYTDDYFEMQQKIFDATLVMAGERDMMIAPVGWVWRSVRLERPDIELFDIDNSHPSLYGSFLSACVIYRTMFQEDLSDNIYPMGLPLDDILYLQNTSSAALEGKRDLYNIVPPDTNGCD